ncbi:hypothetical protein ACT6QH_13305 [Xanthobacter sp. TB0139]|uniref:hypothetical protein n=1 Tax=Xanthobacter sp. TB0139 TaxID=3459178 RepID=UPI00403A4EA6
MAIVVSGSAGPASAAEWVARLSGSSLFLLGATEQGAETLAMVRVPVAAPFKPGMGDGQELSGIWSGTVLRPGLAKSFRLEALEGDLVIMGTVSAPGDGGDLELDRLTLPFGQMVMVKAGRLSVSRQKGQTRGLGLALFGTVAMAPPQGQHFKVHWESWWDSPDVAYPEKFYLTNLPSYVSSVSLCFARPQFIYEGLSDNVQATTGLNFDGTGHQFRNVLDLLRMRQPHIRIALSIQQGGKQGFEPYDWSGWAGMHSGHLASIRRFVDDMGITEIEVDYECNSASMEMDKHCITQPNGDVWCYTDGEMVRVIRAFRDRFPRPKYKLALDGFNTGAYFGPYRRQKPLGWNHGYVAALVKDKDTRDAFDIINVMSFDEQPVYDPVRALEAYVHAFPRAEVYLGLRAGPPWKASRAMTLDDCLDYANATIALGTPGIWLYAMLWDLKEPTPPFNAAHPNGNMMARLVAERFGLPEADRPLVEGLSNALPENVRAALKNL